MYYLVDYAQPTVVQGMNMFVPFPVVQPRILVVGAIKMVAGLHCLENFGMRTTSIVHECTRLPGGKGAGKPGCRGRPTGSPCPVAFENWKGQGWADHTYIRERLAQAQKF